MNKMGYHGQTHHHGHGGGHGHHGSSAALGGGGGRSMLDHPGAVSSSLSNGIGVSTSAVTASVLPSAGGIKTVASSSSVASSTASKSPSVASLCNLGNT